MRGHPPATEGRAELSCFLPRNEGDGVGGNPGQGDGTGVGWGRAPLGNLGNWASHSPAGHRSLTVLRGLRIRAMWRTIVGLRGGGCRQRGKGPSTVSGECASAQGPCA